jgi:putative ABC transport system permease protein
MTLILALFLFLAAVLLAGGLRMTGTMVSSIKGLDRQALPPAFLQIHKGEYDKAAWQSFVQSHEYIRDAAAVEMLVIPNNQIWWDGGNLEKTMMDNGLIVQNESFDFLLDLDNRPARVGAGEIGVPVYYASELGIGRGDVLTLQGNGYRRELKVAVLTRDAQMNSALTSSKRFLVSAGDYAEISRHLGSKEYSFQFLLNEGASTTDLQQDYRAAQLPANGVAVTGGLISLMNALSHGLTAVVILAVSIILVLIALLCLSYIIKATLAEEGPTIGEMKAIGLPDQMIIRLYIVKYLFLMCIAAGLAFGMAFPLGDYLSASVLLYYGEASGDWLSWLLPGAGLVALCLLVAGSCRRMIAHALCGTVIQLMRGMEQLGGEGRYRLPQGQMLWPNLVVALGELQCKWKDYRVIGIVYILAAFLVVLPMNLHSTMVNPSFFTYMGIAASDIRIDVQFSEKLEAEKKAAVDLLAQDGDVARYALYQICNVPIQNKAGETEYLRVQSGDEAAFPLEYLAGAAPRDSGEIALSYLGAESLGKKVGDRVTILGPEGDLVLMLSGVYQDITYGGKTAKAILDTSYGNVEAYIIYMELQDGIDVESKTAELRQFLPGSKVTPAREFVAQTMGGIRESLALVQGVAWAVALLLVALITGMVLQLLLAKEHRAIALKKVIGFSSRDIRVQFGLRMMAVQGLAILVGTVLANVGGEGLLGLLLAQMGAPQIKILINPWSAYALAPALQLGVGLLAVLAGTKAIERYHIRRQINE